MLFNSLEFAVFLAVVLLVYYALLPAPWERSRKCFLLIASYVFYASWNPPFALLLLGSTLLDFGLGLRMESSRSPRRRRILLALSLLGNLGVLGFFKYGGFVTEQFQVVAGWMGAEVQPRGWDVVLPVGISFYTFQTLSYSIDVYRGRQRACRSPLDFALFVSFFPQLVAGPIVRSTDFLPQLSRRPTVEESAVAAGWTRIVAGLMKKVILADSLGQYVDAVFASPGAFGTPNLVLAMYAYAFQIYFDFSGYSDMAIGLAALFGYRIPENFDRPYLATNPREFWQRWHISLSTWLRDYLYIPLGGNRLGGARTYVNVVITMLLGGLWHGAAWTYVAWGGLHGVWLAAHRLVTDGRPARRDGGAVRVLKQIATFHFVCVAYVFFRSSDVASALLFLRRLAVWDFTWHSTATVASIALAVSLVLHVGEGASSLRLRYARLPPVVQGMGYAVGLALVALFAPGTERFIYFQF